MISEASKSRVFAIKVWLKALRDGESILPGVKLSATWTLKYIEELEGEPKEDPVLAEARRRYTPPAEPPPFHNHPQLRCQCGKMIPVDRDDTLCRECRDQE
jgi:hypothetical protein